MIFNFKQFSIAQDKCAMKVGTDGVILGAWTRAENPKTILDIGTGTGLIAIMMAQRFKTALIKAIEIDHESRKQAKDNFQNSPWSSRISTEEISLQEFQHSSTFDLIVSNPPYFENSLKANTKQRAQARHTDTLSFEELIEYSAKMLCKNGTLSMIIPSETKSKVERIAKNNQLHLNRLCWVRGREKKIIKRAVLQFSFFKKNIEKSTLVIEKERHIYTEEYINLCKDFYLRM